MEINQKLIEEICQIANQAANRILEIYDTDFTVESKEDRSPLTAADLAAHNTICKALAELTPEIPVLSEESEELPYSERRQWSPYWLVDPLDGTREFIKRNGEFTVNIALIEDHQARLGVIVVPVSGVCYYAAKSSGAFKINADGITESIKVKKSENNKIILAGSRSHGGEKQQAFINRLGGAEIIAIGSSLKFCLVAEGKVDIYPRFGLTSEWDTAAAQCIVEEAGGCVVDMHFNPIRYNTKESLLNPEFLVIADPSFNWRQYLDEIK
ncbi:MAG: 3'(2'),5'-bisphosphate nucleotidase CysQ [Proteobacteria bacterium]|nr:3'(2'),5'-bisphosphate nucleotidase CysQ [Pseudomonadota bacterium]